ncbi:Protein of unknown function [Pustulibacterium marinum]|uniref:DUF3822 domain-containing protein n=1 Tax=Pustulibacterium marinum TaxID=1224947 RepID=A0A1I7G2J9_9FLAO|nr:DUF3822 family protein [Pustulibacterium marinum]SFU42667.1 Protein of unknown function [Pustulibacterium marinum]
MTQKLTTIKSNTLDKSYKALSIQVSLNGLSFCIHNALNQTIEVLEHTSFEALHLNPETLLDAVKNTILGTEVLLQEFDSLKVVYINNLSAFVPEVIFNEEHLADYLKFNVKILGNDYITYDALENAEMNNVYIPFVNINNFFLDWFGSFEFEHFSSILVNQILKLGSIHSSPQVFVHFSDQNEFQVVVAKNRKLLLYNSFSFHTPEDFIYYLLFTYEQLELNTEEVPLQFISTIDKGNPLYDIAYTFIRNVNTYTLTPKDKLLKIDTNRFLDHFVLINSFT